MDKKSTTTTILNILLTHTAPKCSLDSAATNIHDTCEIIHQTLSFTIQYIRYFVGKMEIWYFLKSSTEIFVQILPLLLKLCRNLNPLSPGL